MPKAKFENIDPAVLDVYKKMIASVRGVELKGANNPYTSVNGNMFSSISKHANRIGVRLPQKDREEFITKHKTTLYEALPGFFQKEYVAVPPALYKDTRALAKLFQLSFEYTAALKPKDTKARKPAQAGKKTKTKAKAKKNTKTQAKVKAKAKRPARPPQKRKARKRRRKPPPARRALKERKK